MKNKKISYFLLPAAIILWLFLMFKIYEMITDKKAPYPVNTTNHSVEEKKLIEKSDTMVLLLNYGDPFLIQKKVVARPAKVKSRSHVAVVKPKPEKIDWPQIEFIGTVQNTSNGKCIVNLTINGDHLIMKPGDICEEIELVKVTTESILVTYKNQKKSIERAK